MRRSTVIFLLLALAAAAGCVRLGFWQLSRRHQRLAMNATISSRIDAAPVPVDRLHGDTTVERFKRVIVTGAPDYAHEFALTLRGNNGSPGVDIVTPVRFAGSDTAVLVNRGWVYSPDGMTVDFAKWHEPNTTFTGYVDSFEAGGPADSIRNGGIRRMAWSAVSRTLPYPVRPFYVVALAGPDSAGPMAGLVRLHQPKLDEGPHLSYAFQWFAFAAIALIGGGIVAARSMHG